ncbi:MULTISPECIES: CHAT domain-containing protein [unclassified Bradyrhizobium]|uniref:CHAT domain-containing protein n=1 Tax=unclassified Bradyrhizobium TaxID=2631580 RepID=UPI001FF7A204|nr:MULTISPECIES: CHAT domain-containing protein [unclassified Bradyrhizobium]MCK1270831.1 CHAT domain-containing protein [Bradyrhizobium sp. 84]MCK1372138.1 CHAT domain-containing protein [Bradyrhizobium sp. 49]MCK1417617.1 CHAT domain-containing protein [Bradyrhizobium sp. CW4]MCK1430591.1 CHAT domain-containing protein [Bradyrhizobium sp. 87]
MTIKFLLVCSDSNLQFAIKEALGAAGDIDLIAIDAETASRNDRIREASPDTVLLLDAQLPRRLGGPLDRQEKSALWLVQELRNTAIATPALFITSREVGIFELDEYCTPDNRAISLPQLRLSPTLLRRFVDMLLGRPTSPEKTWNVIELEVQRTSVKCLLGNREGEMMGWAEASTRMYSAAHQLAIKYAMPPFMPGWARRIHDDGSLLFQQLIIATLGPGLFSHIERSAGGLRNLAFRFRVEDASLYCAPFEATVRLSGLPSIGTDIDFTQDPFVLINAPIARRMRAAKLSTTSQGELRAAKVLFIRSQVGESRAGATGWDIARVPERDPETGRFKLNSFEFRRLENIDRERDDLKSLEETDCTVFSLEVFDLSAIADPRGSEALLMEKLTLNRYDVVHFAGHSLTTRDGMTLLVLPGRNPGQAEGMSIHAFAEGAAAAGAKLVYLSSCQGSSANAVANLAQRDVAHIVGFRWDVDDERAADFARHFYSDLFGRESSTICNAFRTACRGVYEPMQIEASPIWASPILACSPDNWAAQSFRESVSMGARV